MQEEMWRDFLHVEETERSFAKRGNVDEFLQEGETGRIFCKTKKREPGEFFARRGNREEFLHERKTENFFKRRKQGEVFARRGDKRKFARRNEKEFLQETGDIFATGNWKFLQEGET